MLVFSSVAFSPDGKTALSGSAADVRLWDLATGREISKIEGDSADNSVAFSPDGKTALSGSLDGTVTLWDLATGREIRKLQGHSAEVTSVAFSPDGKTALSGSWDETVRLWDLATGRETRKFEGQRGAVFSPDGTTALSISDSNATVTLWDLATGGEIRKLQGHSKGVESAAFSPDGKTALSGGNDNAVRLWDLATGREIRKLQGHSEWVNSVAFSPDGKTALSGGNDNAVRLWDLATGREIRKLEAGSKGVEFAAFSPDGKTALSGGGDNTVRLWDLATGREIRTFKGHSEGVYSVAFSPDGKTALSGSWDKTLRLWDLATGREIRKLEGHSGKVFSVVFLPDGKTALSGSADDTARLWDLATGREIRRLEGHRWLVSVAISPNGKTALSGGGDNTARLWDLTAGREIRKLQGHAGLVTSVAFSPDAKSALSGSFDGTMRLWNLKSGEELAALIASPNGEYMTITPAGFFAASPKAADMLAVVRGFDSYSVMQFYEHLHRPDLVAERLKGDLEGKYQSAANLLNLESILESGPAPKLERLLNREKREGGKAELAVRLTDLGGGIGEKVIWRVNGVAQGADTAPGLDGPVRPGRYVVMEQTLSFDPTQKNEVEVVAHNGKGLLATQPLSFTIDPVFGVLDKPKPRLYVLAVGVDNYLKPDWRLGNAVNDAKTIGEALKAVGGAFFGESNVEVTPLHNEQATEAGIGSAFEELARKVQPQDVFILYLAGHGRAIAGKGPGTGWFFLPQNLDLANGQDIPHNAISAAMLEGWLRKIHASKSVVVLDACESGAYEAPRGENLVTETQIAQFAFATGRSTISAAPAGKAAYEGVNHHGVLTLAMLEAMNRQQGAGDEPVTLLGLGSYVSRRVIEISRQEFGIVQTPKTDLKDDFTLGLRQSVLKPVAVACTMGGEAAQYTTKRSADAREKPAGDAAVTLPLTRNALVTLKACDGEWGLIAYRGKDIGYIRFDALEPVN